MDRKTGEMKPDDGGESKRRFKTTQLVQNAVNRALEQSGGSGPNLATLDGDMETARILNKANRTLPPPPPSVRADVNDPTNIARAEAPKLINSVAPVIEEVRRREGNEKAAEAFETNRTLIQQAAQVVSSVPPDQQMTALEQASAATAAPIQAKQARGEDLSSGDKLTLALLTGLPTLFAGMFGGDERAAAQGGTQILNSYVELDERQKRRAQEAAQFDVTTQLEREKMQNQWDIARFNAENKPSREDKLRDKVEERRQILAIDKRIDYGDKLAEATSMSRQQAEAATNVLPKLTKAIEQRSKLGRVGTQTLGAELISAFNDKESEFHALAGEMEKITASAIRQSVGGNPAASETMRILGNFFQRQGSKATQQEQVNAWYSAVTRLNNINTLKLELFNNSELSPTQIEEAIQKMVSIELGFKKSGDSTLADVNDEERKKELEAFNAKFGSAFEQAGIPLPKMNQSANTTQQQPASTTSTQTQPSGAAKPNVSPEERARRRALLNQ